jgi:rhodanese-related sulfurtransferase
MTPVHRVLLFVAATFGAGAALVDFHPKADVSELAREIETGSDHMSALELAGRLTRRDSGLYVFDLRSPDEFQQSHVDGACQTTIQELVHTSLPAEATIVLYSAGNAQAAQASVLLRMRGYRNVFFLREGLYEWQSRVIEPRLASDSSPAERAEFEQAARLSRFFGGEPKSDVPRAEVPKGYWTNTPAPQPSPRRILRRGC